MPSPFSGMDPYIEQPDLWQDFHGNLAPEIQSRLNQHIQPRYFARLTPYVTYEVIEVAEVRGVRPDVGVWQSQPPEDEAAGGVATVMPAPVESQVPLELPLRLYSVEVRATDTQQFVTAIEILSPVNKRPGHEAYLDYRRKRKDFIRSAAHFLEIDLLRGGERPPLEQPVPPAAYYVTLSRAERRPTVEVWPIQLSERLPVIPVPLLEPDPDVPLDLGAAVTTIYARGAYAQQIDYRQPPPLPPLSEEESAWLDGLLREKGLR
ncbi:MAG: hypothetical protein MAG451_00629 [Anaerolineales bacterium]|nr:hypothetical protein [Anaerolineales bacterium]